MSGPRARCGALRALRAAGCAVALGALTGCAGVAPQPRVRVRVSNFTAIAGVNDAMLAGSRAVVVWTYFRRAEGDAGAGEPAVDAGATDAGAAEPPAYDARWDRARELRRAVFWPREASFEFDVELPEGSYEATRVLVTAAVVCPGRAEPDVFVLAEARRDEPLRVRATGAGAGDPAVAIAWSLEPRPWGCAR